MLGQGTETATFKQLFADWKALGAADPLKKVETGGRVAKSISGKLISSIIYEKTFFFIFQIIFEILMMTLTVSAVRLVHYGVPGVL